VAEILSEPRFPAEGVARISTRGTQPVSSPYSELMATRGSLTVSPIASAITNQRSTYPPSDTFKGSIG